jgi:hypothetical protein
LLSSLFCSLPCCVLFPVVFGCTWHSGVIDSAVTCTVESLTPL